MVSIDKKAVTNSVAAAKRRAAERQYEQTLQGLRTTADAEMRRTRLQDPQRQERYAGDFHMLDQLNDTVRGEIGYRLLGNKRLRTDNPGELTRQHGVLSKTKKVLERDASTGTVRVTRYEKQGLQHTRLYEYDKDGTLSTKHVTRRGGGFEEKWGRDENGELIRTKYVNRAGLKGLFRPVSEEMSSAYKSGPDDRLYRKLVRRTSNAQETYERDDRGNLELLSRVNRSRNFRKAADHKTSQTEIRKFGGAVSKSYRSLLDKAGNELGRDILSRRRLLNKRSATYDERTGELKRTKHTVGKIYKSEAKYLNSEAKIVSKKVLGVTVRKRLSLLSEREREAQNLRAAEAARHKEAWQTHGAGPSRGDPDINGDAPQSSFQTGHHSASPPNRSSPRPGSGSHRQIDAQAIVGGPDSSPPLQASSTPQSASQRVLDSEQQPRVASLFSTPLPNGSLHASGSRFESRDRSPNRDRESDQLIASSTPNASSTSASASQNVLDSEQQTRLASLVSTPLPNGSLHSSRSRFESRDRSPSRDRESGQPNASSTPKASPTPASASQRVLDSEQQTRLASLLNTPLPNGSLHASRSRFESRDRSQSRDRDSARCL